MVDGNWDGQEVHDHGKGDNDEDNEDMESPSGADSKQEGDDLILSCLVNADKT